MPLFAFPALFRPVSVRPVSLAVFGLVGAALFSRELPAQDQTREPGFGRVLDRDGKPWVGAKVFLEYRAHLAVNDDAYCDVIETTTDERGEFRVQVLPASGYDVWARGELENGSDFRQTDLVGGAVARRPILLREARRRGAVELLPRVESRRARKLPPPPAEGGIQMRLSWSETEAIGEGVPIVLQVSGLHQVLRTDATGQVRFQPPVERDAYWLAAPLTHSQRTRLSGDGFPAASVAALRLEGGVRMQDLGDQSVSGLATIDVQVRRADGTPPGCVGVLLLGHPYVGKRPQTTPLGVWTDHLGRVRLFVAKRDLDRLLVVAVGPDGCVLQPCDRGVMQLDLRLDPQTVWDVELKRQDGSPVVGQWCSIEPGSAESEDRDLQARAFHWMMTSMFFRWNGGVTDRTGRVRLVAPLPWSSARILSIGDDFKVWTRGAGEGPAVVKVVYPNRRSRSKRRDR